MFYHFTHLFLSSLPTFFYLLSPQIKPTLSISLSHTHSHILLPLSSQHVHLFSPSPFTNSYMNHLSFPFSLYLTIVHSRPPSISAESTPTPCHRRHEQPCRHPPCPHADDPSPLIGPLWPAPKGSISPFSSLYIRPQSTAALILFRRVDANTLPPPPRAAAPSPRMLGRLTELQYLNLSNSGFSGQVPSDFSNFTRNLKTFRELVFAGDGLVAKNGQKRFWVLQRSWGLKKCCKKLTCRRSWAAKKMNWKYFGRSEMK
ncbi:hypothetical protein ACS0TY_012981 [Phlomoides rotata]